MADWNAHARSAAISALGQLGVEPLVKALGDDDRYVRIAVATALGQLGDPRAVEPLVKALGDDNIDVRIAVATALGQLVAPRAVEPLVKAFGADNGDVRIAAATALGKLGHGKWSQWVKGDSGDFKRLALSRDPEAIEPLVKAWAPITGTFALPLPRPSGNWGMASGLMGQRR